MAGMNTSVRPSGHAAGFTLIELVVALAILAIVSSVALPSYQGSVRKSRRSDASDAATAVLQAQERWRTSHGGYTNALASLPVAATSANGYYALALSNASATGYTLAITPVTGKGQDKDTGCTALSVAVTNGAPAYTPAKCWSR